MANNDGGPAYPISLERAAVGKVSAEIIGMSLQDAIVLQVVAGCMGVERLRPDNPEAYAQMAHYAYEVADAIIVERDKRRAR